MNYWLTGTGIEHVSAKLVAADQRGGDERRARKPARRSGLVRRVIASALVALANRIAPVEVSVPTVAIPATGPARG